MKPSITILAALLFALIAPSQAGAVKLAALFSDHMVLQREQPVPVWGWAKPGEAITVEFAGQKKSAQADAKGRWLVRLDPLAASAEGRELVDRKSVV